MKKLVALLLVWNLSLSGITVFLYATQPEPINRTESRTIIYPSKDGKTPVEGVDFFVRDGVSPSPIQPRQPKEPRQPIDGSNGLSAYEVAVKRGFIGSEEEWLYSLRAQAPDFSPSIICNPLTTRFEYRVKTEDSYQSIPNSKCVV